MYITVHSITYDTLQYITYNTLQYFTYIAALLSLCIIIQHFTYAVPFASGYPLPCPPPLHQGSEELDGSSVLVLNSGFCSVKCLGVLPFPLDEMPGHRRLPPVFCLVALTSCRHHLYSLVERGIVRVECLVQEYSTTTPVRTQFQTNRSGVLLTYH